MRLAVHGFSAFYPEKLKCETLRYLGCFTQNVDEELKNAIALNIQKLSGKITPLYTAGRFALERNGNDLRLGGTGTELIGNDIKALLADCRECFVFAATLGAEADRLIDYHMKLSPSDGVIMDAAASAMIEDVCEQIAEILGSGMNATRRFSCGYGDFPLETQKDILAALDAAREIGLYCNKSSVLIPRKSVTAVIGLSEKPKSPQTGTSCGGCEYAGSCGVKGGNGCGRFEPR